jgi:hypothetical protein
VVGELLDVAHSTGVSAAGAADLDLLVSDVELGLGQYRVLRQDLECETELLLPQECQFSDNEVDLLHLLHVVLL